MSELPLEIWHLIADTHIHVYYVLSMTCRRMYRDIVSMQDKFIVKKVKHWAKHPYDKNWCKCNSCSSDITDEYYSYWEEYKLNGRLHRNHGLPAIICRSKCLYRPGIDYYYMYGYEYRENGYAHENGLPTTEHLPGYTGFSLIASDGKMDRMIMDDIMRGRYYAIKLFGKK